MARKTKPIKILTLDTETYNGLLGALKKIAIYDGENVTYGNSFSEIESELLRLAKSYILHIYIHNMEFDLRKIPEVFDSSRIDWEKCFIIKGKLATVSCKHYVFHDSFKLLPMSLSKLSKGFNVEHGKLDLWDEVQRVYPGQYKNLVDFLDRCPIDDPLFIKYLGYDVISLYEILNKLIQISGLSVKDFVGRISTASLSRFLFKKGWKEKQFKSPLNSRSDFEMLSLFNWHNNLEVEEFLRLSYCGGRTEVFKPILDHQGFHYDVNSLYPSVMIGQQYPIGEPFFSEDSVLAEHYFQTWKTDKIGLGFISARVHIPKQHIPPLPLKMGKLCFACGDVYGVWTYEELEYAISECGVTITEFKAVCHFKLTYPVFDRFIGSFYELKEQASIDKNEPLRTFAKLIMNVGYGYTGMRRDDKTSLKSIREINNHKDVVYSNFELGFIEIPTEIKAEYIQVQIASYVTSRARLVLLKALRNVEKNGANVYYCDTDSIVTDKPFDDSLVHDSHIGYWACEEQPTKALFLRPKVYVEHVKNQDNVKFKGISKDTQSELNYESYENILQEMILQDKDSIVIEKNKFMLRSIMYMQKQGLDPLYYETRDKKINIKTIEKRRMFYNENYTAPYYFETVEDFEKFSFTKPDINIPFDMTSGGNV